MKTLMNNNFSKGASRKVSLPFLVLSIFFLAFCAIFGATLAFGHQKENDNTQIKDVSAEPISFSIYIGLSYIEGDQVPVRDWSCVDGKTLYCNGSDGGTFRHNILNNISYISVDCYDIDIIGASDDGYYLVGSLDFGDILTEIKSNTGINATWSAVVPSLFTSEDESQSYDFYGNNAFMGGDATSYKTISLNDQELDLEENQILARKCRINKETDYITFAPGKGSKNVLALYIVGTNGSSISEVNVNISSDTSTPWGTVSATTAKVYGGTTISCDGNKLYANGTLIATATPNAPDDNYFYQFDKWTYGSSNTTLTASGVSATSNMTFKAKFKHVAKLTNTEASGVAEFGLYIDLNGRSLSNVTSINVSADHYWSLGSRSDTDHPSGTFNSLGNTMQIPGYSPKGDMIYCFLGNSWTWLDDAGLNPVGRTYYSGLGLDGLVGAFRSQGVGYAKSIDVVYGANSGTIINSDGSYYVSGEDKIGPLKEIVPPEGSTYIFGCVLRINWATERTVSFNSNGGSSVSPSSIKVAEGADYNYFNFPRDPTRTGYTFAGWYTSQTGGTRIYGSTTFSGTSSQTLYAHWTANALTFADQTLNKGTYGTAYTSNAFPAASNGTGSYSYAITSVRCDSTTVTANSGKYNGLSLNGMKISGTPTRAGTYKFAITVTDNNSGATKTATMTITIDKANGYVTLDSTTDMSLTYPNKGTKTVKTNHGGTLSVSSSSTGIATVAISGTTVTVTAGTTAGTATITVKCAATTNYKKATVTFKAVVANGTITITKTDGNVTYDGKEKTAQVASNVAGVKIVYGTSTSYGTTAVESAVAGTKYTIAKRTDAGSVTVYYKATKAGYKDVTGSVTLTINKANNPIAVTTPQTWNTSYSTSEQKKSITAATNAQGNVTYNIQSQKTGSTTVNSFALSGTTLTMAGSTGVGTYTVVIRATAAGNGNYNSGYKDITMTVTVGKATLGVPGNLAVAADGKVTWNTVTGATGYQISIDNTNWKTATSGVDYNSTIVAATGSRTVYVRAVSTNSNYTSPSGNASKTVTVYQLTVEKGTGIASVTGAGKYISGRSVTIKATASTGYSWSKWTVNSGGSTPANVNAASTTVAVKVATTLTATATAITYTIKYDGNGATRGGTASSTHTYNEEKALTANGFIFAGYSFEGWATSANGSVAYSNNAKVKNLANTQGATVTLYAKWTASTYSVTIDPNGGKYNNNTSTTTVSGTFAGSTTIADPTRDGYTFAGWKLDGTGSFPRTVATVVGNYTSSIKTDTTTGINYTNYIMDYTGNGNTYYPALIFPNYNFTAGKTYVLTALIRKNEFTNTQMQLRFGRIVNDYYAGNTFVDISSESGWRLLRLERTFDASYTINGNTFTTKPCVEFRSGNYKTSGIHYRIDFDIAYITVTEKGSSATALPNYSYNNFKFGTGNATLTAQWLTNVTVPTANNKIYTGSEITGINNIPNTDYATLTSGTYKAKNAGNYSATYKITNNWCIWADGTNGAKTIEWSIANATLSAPTGLSWDVGTAKWNAVSKIGDVTVTYKVQLYKGNNTQGDAVTISAISKDFASVIRNAGTGTYAFTVQAISSDTKNVNSSSVSAKSGNQFAVKITMKNGTGIASAKINKDSSYVMINGESDIALSATASAGYTFSGYTSSSAKVTISSDKASYSTTAQDAEVIITATATQNSIQITMTFNVAVNGDYIVYILNADRQPIYQFVASKGTSQASFTYKATQEFTVLIFRIMDLQATIGDEKTSKRTYSVTASTTIPVKITSIDQKMNNWASTRRETSTSANSASVSSISLKEDEQAEVVANDIEVNEINTFVSDEVEFNNNNDINNNEADNAINFINKNYESLQSEVNEVVDESEVRIEETEIDFYDVTATSESFKAFDETDFDDNSKRENENYILGLCDARLPKEYESMSLVNNENDARNAVFRISKLSKRLQILELFTRLLNANIN